jgi:hypothetical protein
MEANISIRVLSEAPRWPTTWRTRTWSKVSFGNSPNSVKRGLVLHDLPRAEGVDDRLGNVIYVERPACFLDADAERPPQRFCRDRLDPSCRRPAVVLAALTVGLAGLHVRVGVRPRHLQVEHLDEPVGVIQVVVVHLSPNRSQRFSASDVSTDAGGRTVSALLQSDVPAVAVVTPWWWMAALITPPSTISLHRHGDTSPVGPA